MSKRHNCAIVKVLFLLPSPYIFMKIPGEKTLFTLPVRSILKQLIETKNEANSYFHTSL